MALKHKSYTKNGRELDVVDKEGKPTGEKVYKGGSRQVNVLDGEVYKPYLWDSNKKVCKFNDYEIRLTASGVEIYQGSTKLLGLGAHPEIEVDSVFERKTATVSGLATRTITTETSADRIEISYDVDTSDMKSNITFEVGGRQTVKFGCALNAKVLNEKQRLNLEFDQKATLATSSIGKIPTSKKYVFADKKSFWKWDNNELTDHKIVLGEAKTEVILGEKVYTSLAAEKVAPDTWGPTNTSDDCIEAAGAYADEDANGDLACGYYSGYGTLHSAWKFLNVAIGAGATCNDGCKITCPLAGSSNGVGSGAVGVLKVEDSRTPADFDADHLPSDRTWHNTTVNWSSDVDSGSIDSPEAKTVFQQRFDDDHVSGDNWVLGWFSTQSSGTNFQTTEADAADLTVVYTPASGETLTINVHDCADIEDILL